VTGEDGGMGRSRREAGKMRIGVGVCATGHDGDADERAYGHDDGSNEGGHPSDS
jgi:hypothetical protein